MSSKNSYSDKILKLLSRKSAVSVQEILSPKQFLGENKYAVTRSFKGLQNAGLVETLEGGQGEFARLTREGRKKAHSIKLEGDGAILSTTWDGFWRMVILDMPEERKNERDALRYLLKKAGFICVKNSVWISPHPFENLFVNIKKDLGLSTEMMVLVTDKLDPSTEEEFLKLI